MSDESAATPAVCVVVPTRNRPHVLGRLVRSLAAQRDAGGVELILIDDASVSPVDADAVRDEAATDRLPPIRVLREDLPVGACRARNVGIAAAAGRYVLFLDDDVELVGDDLLVRLLGFADRHPRLGVVALAELAPDGGWGFNLGPDGPPLEVARFLGCGALFRRACLAEAGGFFEPLGYYYEEFELSMRVIDAGWRIVFHPAMRIVHHRDAVGRDVRRIARLISRNALLTAAARFPAWMLPVAVATQIVRFARRSWFTRPFDPLGPLAASAAAARLLPSAISRRRPIRSEALRRYRRLAGRPTRFVSDGPAPSAVGPSGATS